MQERQEEDHHVSARLLGLGLVAVSLLVAGFAGSLIWASAFGPFRSVDGTVDVAREVSTVGGTGVRGGGMSLNVLLAERLSPTPYQPEFRLTFAPLFDRSYETAQRLPRGTAVTLTFRDGDLAAALAYGRDRLAVEEIGETYRHSWISPEWVVHLTRIEWREQGAAVVVSSSRFAELFWSVVLLVIAVAIFGAGRRGLQGHPLSVPPSGANTP